MAKKIENQDYRPSHEEIAARAYEIFEQSGKVAGHDTENWLAAEAQLVAAQKQESGRRAQQNGRQLQMSAQEKSSMRQSYRA